MLKKTLFLVTLLFSTVAALGGTAPAASQADSEIASYVVTLRDGSTDAVASIVHMYGGKLERRDASSFTLRISAARARRLASDPRVRSVVALSSGRAVVETSAPKELGPYIYDGAGNIQSMATEKFAYDLAGRLTDASLLPGRQQFSYDAFGNRTTAATTGNMTRCNGGADCHDAPAIASATNRISAAGYDVAGNLTSYAGNSYVYDPLNMMTSESAGDLQFVYTADDERIAVYNDVQWKWAIRDAQAHVVREFTSPASAPANWTWTNDNVFRGALLLASDSPTAGRRHYHLDHLGTPRLITDDYGRTVAEYEYYPFGTDPDSNTREAQDEQSLEFTGHQRDLAHGDLHVLDYMHARYYDGAVGRFLSVDPSGWTPAKPQSWNRYAYVVDEPMGKTDPDGRDEFEALVHGAGTHVAAVMRQSSGGEDPVIFTAKYHWARFKDDPVGVMGEVLSLALPAAEAMDAMPLRVIADVDALSFSRPAPATVTREVIDTAMANAPLDATQKSISVPVVQRFVDRAAAGEVAPPIKVDGTKIVEGHHRYVAGRIVGKEPPVAAGTAAPSTRVYNWITEVFKDLTDWGNK